MMDTRWYKLISQWLIAITLCALAGCEGEPIDSSTSSSASSDATSRPFITTWKTDAGDEPNKNEILIRTTGENLNYHIDWGTVPLITTSHF